ncbi:MAG: shikimate kinase [Oscillospiraceae bacterium]|nr:shikimate kinase [Oscillospiraceae bacterium]
MAADERNVVLIGMMNSGKTTAGGLLAQALGRPLEDTDKWIEQREGKTVSQIFADDGEPHFRARELDACRDLGQRSGLVIACGGGLPLTPGCMEALKTNGIVFWLARDPGESYDDMETSGRPLARQGRGEFISLYESREPVYRQWADEIIRDFSSPAETVNRILEVLER